MNFLNFIFIIIVLLIDNLLLYVLLLTVNRFKEEILMAMILKIDLIFDFYLILIPFHLLILLIVYEIHLQYILL
jgi:hypothetical protein